MKSVEPAVEPLLTREEVAEMLQTSVSWVRKQIRSGKLRSVKLGKLVRIERQDLRAFIERLPDSMGGFVGTPYLPGLFPTVGGDDARDENKG